MDRWIDRCGFSHATNIRGLALLVMNKSVRGPSSSAQLVITLIPSVPAMVALDGLREEHAKNRYRTN